MFGFARREPDLTTKAEPVFDPPAAVEPPPVGTIAYPDEDLFAIFGIAVGSISVSPRSALGCTPVSAAVRVLSETAGQLPFYCYRRGPNESREIDREHPANAFLNGDANEWTSAQDLRAQLVSDALLYGNGYAFANRVEGRVVEMLRLDPRSVSIEVDQVSGEPTYILNLVNGGARGYGVRDVLHLRGPHLDGDGVTGLAAIKVAADAIRFALAMQRHGVNLFERGARPGGVLLAPKEARIDGETRKRMKAGWQAYEGSGNAGKTPFLEGGVTYQPHALNSVDAQYLELRRFVVDEISRAFGVPAHMLAELGRATWSNIGDLGREFLTYGLSPWLTRLEAGYRRVLLSFDERADLFIESETDALVAADGKTRAETLAQLRSARIITANEGRSRENLPPHPDGDSLDNPNTTSGAKPGNPANLPLSDENPADV